MDRLIVYCLPVDGDVHHVADKLEVDHGADGRSEGGADCFSLTIEKFTFQNQIYMLWKVS